METASYAVVFALFAGTVRALMLWRSAIGVEVVNVAVLGALAEGRGRELRAMLRDSGSAPYLDVAADIGQSLLELRADGVTAPDLAKRLKRQADLAIVAAIRRLKRHAWLDYLCLGAILVAGIEATVRSRASHLDVLGPVAATLLWLSNLHAARSIATRSYAGATALVDSLLASVGSVPSFALEPERAPDS